MGLNHTAGVPTAPQQPRCIQKIKSPENRFATSNFDINICPTKITKKGESTLYQILVSQTTRGEDWPKKLHMQCITQFNGQTNITFDSKLLRKSTAQLW